MSSTLTRSAATVLLGAVALAVVIATVAIMVNGDDVPGELFAMGSTAIGGLAGVALPNGTD